MSDLLRFTADVELQAAKGKPPRLSGTAYSGGVMRIAGFGNVIVDLVGMEIPASLPLLAEHDSTIAGVVGNGSPQSSNGTLLVNGTLIAGETSSRIVAIAQGGVPLSLSIGAEPLESRHVREGQTVQANGRSHTAPAGGVAFITKSRLREISIVVVGADPGAGANIAAEGNPTMTEPTATVVPPAESPELVRARLVSKAITEYPAAAERFNELEIKANAEAWEPDKLELELVRASRPRPTPSHGRGTQAGTQQSTLEASLLLRAGFEDIAVKAFGEQMVEAAHRSRIGSLVDLCGASLRAEGRDVPQSTDQMIRAAFSTATLPNILSNVTGRALISAFNDTTSNWRSFCAVKSAANFRSQTDIRPSSFQTLEEVGAAGEIKHATLDEDGVYSWKVDTFAKMIGITRQDVINDDLGAFDNYAPLLGQSAGRSLNDLVWTVIMGGEAAGFFASGNANLGEAGSVLGITSLTAAVAAMKKQTDARGYVIDNVPVALAVPPDIEATARALLQSQEIVAVTDATTPSGNPMKGIVSNLVSEARLSNSRFTGYSTAAWYLFAGPMSNAVVVGFLQGKQAPTVEIAEQDFNKLGIQMRVFFDYGVALGDPRGARKSTGAS